MPRELPPNATLANRYIVSFRAGRGNAGGAVYGIRDASDPDGVRKVLKYPVRKEELVALKSIAEVASELGLAALGIPQMLDSGIHYDRPYLVMHRLGKPIKEFVQNFAPGDVGERWQCVRILGRMAVRRLESVHRCGFVHCDVQPANIIMAGNAIGLPDGLFQPFLIDFGCAQPLNGGRELRADFGSVDFNSIRTAHGGTRGPFDDLESLGYVLCNLLFDQLPWFPYTKNAQWHHGKLSDNDRPVVCGAVSESKAKFVDALEPQELEQIPEELLRFLRLAYRHGTEGRDASETLDSQQMPDYRAFETVLGCSNAAAAEEADISALKAIASHKTKADAERKARLKAEREKTRVESLQHAAPEQQAIFSQKKVAQTSAVASKVSSNSSPQHPASHDSTARETAATGNTANDKQEVVEQDKEPGGIDKHMEFLKRRSQRSDSSKDTSAGGEALPATEEEEDEEELLSRVANPVGLWSSNMGRSMYEITNLEQDRVSQKMREAFWFRQFMANGRSLYGQVVRVYEGHVNDFADSSMLQWDWLVMLNNEGYVRLRRVGNEIESSYMKPGTTQWMLPKRAQRLVNV